MIIILFFWLKLIFYYCGILFKIFNDYYLSEKRRVEKIFYVSLELFKLYFARCWKLNNIYRNIYVTDELQCIMKGSLYFFKNKSQLISENCFLNTFQSPVGNSRLSKLALIDLNILFKRMFMLRECFKIEIKYCNIYKWELMNFLYLPSYNQN